LILLKFTPWLKTLVTPLALAKFLVMPSQYLMYTEVAIAQQIFACEKAKALPISLAKVSTFHRIAVGRNIETWWRYEGGPML